MALATRRGNTTAAKKDKDKSTANTGSTGAGDMPGTTDDEEEIYVSKAPPPANGKYRARLARCYLMRTKDGERVKDKTTGEPLPPKLEFIVDDPTELDKLRRNEPSQQNRAVGQMLDLQGNFRDRSMKLCAGLGFPEGDWPEVEKTINGRKVNVLRFPMAEIDALKEKVDGEYRYFLIDVSTTKGSGKNKDVPYTNVNGVTAWVPKAKAKGKGKVAEEKTEEDTESSEDTEVPGEPTEDGPPPTPNDDDIPF